jgi:polyphosphate kinase 2
MNKQAKKDDDKSARKAAAVKDKGKGKSKVGADAKGRVERKAGKIGRKEYNTLVGNMHTELVHLQQWLVHAGLKVCVVFEGRDGAGKGGTIKTITERVSPRVFRIAALPAPSDREKSQMYLQRYVSHFPAAGEMTIFDRSWYNRAGVERVMGFTKPEKVKRFLETVPLFEKAMVDSGIILIKYWLEVNPEEQTKRLNDRIEDSRKVWKLSPMDVQSYTKWHDYSRARDDMLTYTNTDFAPWHVVPSDDKKKARLNLISHLLSSIPYKKLPREKIELPKRSMRTKYQESDWTKLHVPQKF